MYEKYNGGLCYGKYKKGFIMKNYFEKLQSKVDKYKNKYAQRPRKAAFKLAWWNFKCIFKKHKITKFDKKTYEKNLSNNNVFKIAITFYVVSFGYKDFSTRMSKIISI